MKASSSFVDVHIYLQMEEMGAANAREQPTTQGVGRSDQQLGLDFSPSLHKERWLNNKNKNRPASRFLSIPFLRVFFLQGAEEDCWRKGNSGSEENGATST
jgi:hypothetical protein